MDSSATIYTATRTATVKSSTAGSKPVGIANYEDRLTDVTHLHRIAQIARKQTQGTRLDWQDVLQSAQLKLIIGLRAGKFNGGSTADFDRWAMTVAKYEIIDLVRKSRYREWESIDRLRFGERQTLLDTLAAPLDVMTLLESRDLLERIDLAVWHLDRLYPDRDYYRLWSGKVSDRNQTEIAKELRITQSAVSKRWRELLAKLLLELGLESKYPIDFTPSQQQW
jgi:RNA polymerase sigma factor (sigma-70 family)